MLHEHFDFYSLNGSLEDINGHMYIALHKVNLPKHDEWQIISVEADCLFQTSFCLKYKT